MNSLTLDQYNQLPKVSLRKVFGQKLLKLGTDNSEIVVVDADTSNSTFTNLFGEQFPDRFFKTGIAEQNMISMATGLSRGGKIAIAATFGAFLMRAADQIRMVQYSQPHVSLKVIGTHCGVSIGEDGPSQMALEDISFFRCIQNSIVLYPCDSQATSMLTEELLKQTTSVNYLRVTRAELPLIYSPEERFEIGGSKTLIEHASDNEFTIFAAGITLHEALKAAWELEKKGIGVRVVDMYSIKPLDLEILKKANLQTSNSVLVVEDHYPEGGLYEAICATGLIQKPIYQLAVKKNPRSGSMEDLLAYEEIDADAICNKIYSLIREY